MISKDPLDFKVQRLAAMLKAISSSSSLLFHIIKFSTD